MALLHRKRALVLTAMAPVCLMAALLIVGSLISFSQTAGPEGVVPSLWPESSTIRRTPGHSDLLVFVHPFCSCSAATLSELARLNGSRYASHPRIRILFAGATPAELEHNPLWNQAQEIAGAQTVWDPNGREARRFGALTSGSTLLYSPEGELLFRGGITGARGHRGDNYGFDRLRASLETGRPSTARTLVFGCALFSQGSVR